MGIRDVSYYGWENIDVFQPQIRGQQVSASYTDVTVDSSGSIYVCGWAHQSGSGLSEQDRWIVKKSIDDGASFSTVFESASSNVSQNRAFAIGVDSQDRLYVVGSHNAQLHARSSSDHGETWGFQSVPAGFSFDAAGAINYAIGLAFDSLDRVYTSFIQRVQSSSDNGNTWGGQDIFGTPDNKLGSSLVVDSNDIIYCAGGSPDLGLEINRSTDAGVTWSPQTINQGGGVQAFLAGVGKDSSNNIFAVGGNDIAAVTTDNMMIMSGTTTFFSSSIGAEFDGLAYAVDVDSKDSIYIAAVSGTSTTSTRWMVARKEAYGSNTFEIIDFIDNALALNMHVDRETDNIYVCGQQEGKAFLRRGRLRSNSASLGSSMFATSIGFVRSEVSGVIDEGFKLNNISEFPHSVGAFQMRNLILGTTDSGKIGGNDDSIVQVRQFGSIVRIFWPRQDTTVEEVPIRGFGDFSIGQRAGKLVAAFESGDTHDVTEHDHLALYCYLLKQTSGTLDDVEIRVERRPLKSVGYAVDQAIEYETSGSVTVAKLRDLIYKKEVDYGDLSMKEIGFPIDIPLSNVKEVRISCRHTVGQADDVNKNFVVWGRLIKSEEET